MTPRRPLARKPGFTGLINEDMVSKADIRLRAIGAIDEASASPAWQKLSSRTKAPKIT